MWTRGESSTQLAHRLLEDASRALGGTSVAESTLHVFFLSFQALLVDLAIRVEVQDPRRAATRGTVLANATDELRPTH
jgi:hypothetical protein